MPDTEIPPEASARPGRSVRWHLAVFALALALPIVVLVGALFWRAAVQDRTQIEDDAAETTRAIALAIDRDVTGLTSALEVLSISVPFTSQDLPALHAIATRLGARQDLVPILSDMSGQQIVNVRVPWGAALPKTALPYDAAAIAAGRPYTTDLFSGALVGTPLYGVAMPIMQDGKPAYVLSFSMEPARLQRIIAEADLPKTWVASILDRNGRVMARSTRQAESVGRTAPADFIENATGAAGKWTGTTLDGAPILGVYARSRLTGFRVAIGIGTNELNAPIQRSLMLFLAIGLAIASLSVGLALFVGQRITAPIVALARGAVALGRGEPVEPLATGLLEANQVGREIAGAAASLRERQADLTEANDEIQRFAYIVSHDLRSPLVNIMGFTTELETLRDDVFERIATLRRPTGPGTPLDAKAGTGGFGNEASDDTLREDFDEALGFIKTSISKMDRLINAVLSLSREGRRSFNPERIDMDGLVQAIRDSMAHQSAAAGVEIHVGKLPAVKSDRLALEQIVSNLVDNAIKYMRPGQPGRIDISGRAAPGGLVYEVRDNGRGIDVRDRERVFELFRRSGVQDRPGEGIGLAHVRALVRRLGGNIALTSEIGQGSTFAITLPRRWSGERKKEAA